MKKSTRIISAALASMMVASTLVIGGVSASAASKVKAPKGVKAANVSKGIKISWKKVKGAKKYKVFCGKKTITTTKKKAYTYKKVKAGKTYKFCVKAVKGKKTSKKSKTVKVVRLNAPKMSSAKIVSSGVKATWKKAKGAKKYNVYRGTKKVATVKGTSYTDKKAKTSGTKYTYKVKAVNGKSTSVFSNKKSTVYLAAPKVKVSVTGNTATVSWNKVKGAASYNFYTQKFFGSKSKATVVKGTSTKYDLGKNPTQVFFTVVAVKGSAKSVSSKEVSYVHIPDGSYKTDKEGNLNVNITLKKGASYSEGSFLIKRSTTGTYTVSGNDKSIATVSSDGVIKAVKAGKTTITVTLKTEAMKKAIYNGIVKAAGKDFGNKLTTGKILVNVTVTA